MRGTVISAAGVLGLLAAALEIQLAGGTSPFSCATTEPSAITVAHPVPTRAFTGFLADSDSALMEFFFMTYASWTMHIHGYHGRFDLVVAGDPALAPAVASVCNVVKPGVDPTTLRSPGKLQECFFFPYPDRAAEHYGFFGINQAAFLLDETIGSWLRQYDLLMKSDFDVFLLPGLANFFPPKDSVVFGHQLFVLVPEVSEKIKNVTAALGLRVREDWQHNTGMTSYGKPEDIQAVARHMINALKYMLENTFEQRPEGGPEIDFSGFPGWCMYVLAMYAQEIGANHHVDNLIIDPRLDAFSDLDVPTSQLLHVHCQQGAKRFNKQLFFRHNYWDVDLARLDRSVSKDCVTMLAVASFRIAAGGSLEPKNVAPDGHHSEL